MVILSVYILNPIVVKGWFFSLSRGHVVSTTSGKVSATGVNLRRMWSSTLGAEKSKGQCPVNCVEDATPTSMIAATSMSEDEVWLHFCDELGDTGDVDPRGCHVAFKRSMAK
jgi:hypothetical protein